MDRSSDRRRPRGLVLTHPRTAILCPLMVSPSNYTLRPFDKLRMSGLPFIVRPSPLMVSLSNHKLRMSGGNPQSAIRIPHSAFRIPQSAIRNPHSGKETIDGHRDPSKDVER